MASNAFLTALSHLVACSPCAGTFGRWKANLQDDDADLWNDLTLVNAIPGVKPPDIPKVVEVVSCSDGSDEDVSTLAYESSSHNHLSSPPRRTTRNTPREEEKSFTPSPKRSEGYLRQGTSRHSTTYRDPELEQVLEEIGDDDDSGESDAELESIMGPRSQISMARSHISRSIRRASSAPVVAARPISLLQQQQREYYQSPDLERHYSDSPSVTKVDSEEECRDNFDETIPLALGRSEVDCGDGSSYSSVNQKISFFKRKRISLFRGSSNGSSYKKAGANGGWLPLEHSGSSTEDTTVSTSTSKSKGFHRSHSRLKFKPFH